MGNNKGILLMVFSIIALVLGVSMFPYIMTYLDDLLALGLTDLLLLELVIGFAPTLLMLGLFGGSAMIFISGLKQTSARDANGIIRIVIAFIGIILFVAMFANVATVFLDLWTTYEADPNYPIFGLICGIMPTIIFLSAIAGFIGSGVSGYQANRRRKHA